MSKEIIVIIGTLLVSLGVMSANPMFPLHNRPKIFRKGFGQYLFLIITGFFIIGAISLLIWSFREIVWYLNILILVGTISIFSYLYDYLPAFIRFTAMGPIIAFIGLLIFHYYIWS